MKSVRAYESQFVRNSANFSIFAALRSENAYWGVQIGCEFGEPFYLAEQVRVNSAAALLQI